MARARIEEYVPFWFWGNWHIDEPLAEGCFGSVYRVYHEEEGQKEFSVVKIISIPTEEQYREAKTRLGQDTAAIKSFFENLIDDLVKELRAYHYLSNKINIFSYQDLLVVKRESELGWDILIRMELATPLADFLAERQLSRGQVAWLGMDLCTTLAESSAHGLVHGDIKESNIFFTDDGLCKLGDFSLARHLSKISRDSFLRGSLPYLAPEVYHGAEATAASDIYSLGTVLYKLLNHGRLPFMQPDPQTIQQHDISEAIQKRLQGEPLPVPDQAGEMLGPIILKACAFRPEDRYPTALELKRDLENAMQGLSDNERNELLIWTNEQLAIVPQTGVSPLSEKQPHPAAALLPEKQPRPAAALLPEISHTDEQKPSQVSESPAGIIQFEDDLKPQNDDRKRRILWIATLIALFIGIAILLGYLIAPSSMNRFFTSIFARGDNRSSITTTIKSETTSTTAPSLNPTTTASAALTTLPAPKPTPTATPAPTPTPKPTTTAKPTPTPTPRPTTKATSKATTKATTTATTATTTSSSATTATTTGIT